MRNEDIKILIVDDEPDHVATVSEALAREGYRSETAISGEEALRKIDASPYDIVITDVKMEGVDGIQILNHAKKRIPDVEVVMMSAYGTIDSAVEAMRKGAADYIQKPLNLGDVRVRVAKVVDKQNIGRDNIELHRQLDKRFGFQGIIGNTEQMNRVYDIVHQIAGTDVTVLIEGESGTGKELIAHAVHQNSKRKRNHFVPLNCAALSEGILESELFGHEKGSFTGATYQRKGRFEFADRGTLFLDEIGDMPLTTQMKLLRVIEHGEVLRVGSNVPIIVDVRLLAATNKSLSELVETKKFREDLYYRLKVITISLAPLRERPADIPLLVNAFSSEFAQRHGKKVTSIDKKALDVLYSYPWPGNVRELRNCVEAMVVMAKGDTIVKQDIPEYVSQRVGMDGLMPAVSGLSMESVEKELIKHTLAQTDGNRAETAKRLGMGERTLYRKLRAYGLE
jgi:two-component system response regulator HydG